MESCNSLVRSREEELFSSFPSLLSPFDCSFCLDFAGLEVVEEDPDLLPVVVDCNCWSGDECSDGEGHVLGVLRAGTGEVMSGF